ncbi:hypothetical protein BDZ89DRAFT_950249 [Hymenopellis radicata]|nr:hypothetical protein BDZ89DRAFT_950249 [Hymenopellis radicata]
MDSQRDEQLLSVGQQCSHPSCLLVDFLPFKCQHCAEAFCQEHFLAKDHSCPSYDETKHNRIAPHCPLCNEPVAIPPGQDPNIRMDTHLTKECTVMTGRAKQKSKPVCQSARCGKVLYSPIRCDKCHKQFCPSHRFPSDHRCSPAPVAQSSRLLNLSAPNINTKALNAKASAATDALKKHIPTSLPKPSPQPSTSPPPASPLFSPKQTGEHILPLKPSIHS